MKLSVLVASLMLAALPAFAQSVRVVDGDTLSVDGVTYRESTRPKHTNLAPTTGQQDGLPPNICAH
jgi:hypothetical protein